MWVTSNIEPDSSHNKQEHLKPLEDSDSQQFTDTYTAPVSEHIGE